MPKKGQLQQQQLHVKAVEAQEAAELITLATANASSLPVDAKLRLARADAAPCDGGCRGNTKANPSCFCGWVPAEGGFKKQGLWRREQDSLLASLGTDPRPAAREVGLSARSRCAASLALL